MIQKYKIILIAFLLIHNVKSVSFQSLYQRQLKSSYGFQILKYYHDQKFGNQHHKKFNGQSILFMAPWRTHGMDMSLKYMKKFNYFVPCFYDLKKKRFQDQNNQTIQQIDIKVSQYHSEQYLIKVKEANPDVKILPRVYVDGMQGDVFFLSSTQPEQQNKLINYFRQVLQNKNYDGVYFSSPFMTPNHKYPFSMKNILKQIRDVADQLNKLIFIGMQGVDDKPDNKINKKKARELIELADRVVVSNYDYPRGNTGVTIPISPMKWIQQNYDFYCGVYGKSKLTPKLIMAIPLYGYFVGLYGKYDPIQGKQFLVKIKDEKQAYLYWNQEIQECMIYLNKMEYIYFPCLHFLNSRLRLFERLNIGVGAFEIGGGLQIFMQMF